MNERSGPLARRRGPRGDGWSATVRARLAATALAALVGACTTAPQEPVAGPAPGAGACGAEKAAFALQRLATPELVRRVETAVSHRMVRVLRQGEPHTLEHSPGRLTLELNVDGRVVAVRCG